MFGRARFLRTVVIAAAATFAWAGQAEAGFDLTDEVTVSTTTGGALFNGMGSAAFNTSFPGGLPWRLGQHAGGGPVTITDTVAPGTAMAATLHFTYNPALSGVTVVDYNTTNGYDLYIDISSITSGTTGPAAGFVLSTVSVVDAVAGAQIPVGPPIGLPAAPGVTRVHLTIPPGAQPGGIPPANRTQVITVALAFSWTGGLGNAITIDAVANPEPSTMALFGVGILGLGAGIVRRRRKRAAAAATS